MIYDTKNALVWSPGNDPKSTLFSRTCFERPPLRMGNELLFADYRSNFIQEDGTGAIPGARFPAILVRALTIHD
ncbi:hypothetical protein JW926_00330 [Candidatus Sumerlaeota bacterium]|nr:hypothetical protein [Candidatus Sumerlaeota bacterium]